MKAHQAHSQYQKHIVYCNDGQSDQARLPPLVTTDGRKSKVIIKVLIIIIMMMIMMIIIKHLHMLKWVAPNSQALKNLYLHITKHSAMREE